MLIQTRGIVFRSIKYSETSIITDIFTQEKGLRSYIVSGVRKAKPKFSSSLFQIMSQVELTAYERENKDLNRIVEIRPDHVYRQIPFNVKKTAIGTFMMELCQKSIKEREANPELFQFLKEWFILLDEFSGPIANLHLRFMLELSSQLGFQPYNNYSDNEKYFNLEEGVFSNSRSEGRYILDEETSKLLLLLMDADIMEIDKIRLSREKRTHFMNELITFYRLHIENFTGLNSAQVLAEVLR